MHRDVDSFPTRRSSDLSALAGGAMSKLFGGGQKAASKQFRHGATSKSRSNTASNSTKHKSPHLSRSEERFSRNAETDIVCRLLLEKKKNDLLTLLGCLLHHLKF